MQNTQVVGSLLAEPILYVSELQFSIGKEELMKIFHDVEPTSVDIHRQPGSIAPLSGTIRFSTVENAERAFAFYNNTKLEAYKTLLKLHLTDPSSPSNEPQAFAAFLQIKQLPSNITSHNLFHLFRPFGPLSCIRLQYQDQRFKGCALVQFFKQEDTETAQRSMHCSEVHDKIISVSICHSRPNKPTIRTNITNPIFPPAGQSFSPPGYNSNNQQPPASPGPEGPNVDPCNLFIKNLDANISSSDLFNHFRKFGRIISARVMKDQETGNSKGFGFVSYGSADEADKAKSYMHGKTLGSKQIVVRLHEPKKLREQKLANHYNGGLTSPSESRAPSRRNSDLFLINTVNEFGQDDLSGLAPKARREVLMSELQKRFKYIPSVPQDEVNPIIDYMLNMKTAEILHILKDATALQQKITEARHHLQQEKQHRSSEETLVNTITNNNNIVNFTSQVPQRDKFLKAIMKLCSQYQDEVLELILSLSAKERSLCYFNTEFLNKKIFEAYQALEVIHCDDNITQPASKPLACISSTSTTIKPPDSHATVPVSVHVNPVTADTSTSIVHDAAYKEIEQFIDSLKNKPLHEQKQQLGTRLFPKVKSLSLKSALASKVTISLLDTFDLRELALSMVDQENFRQKVLAAVESTK